MKSEFLSRIIRHRSFNHILFIFILLATSYYYNYQEIITYRPTSKHQWRNCVSASVALNYYYEGDFFHSRTHNMQAEDHTSDVSIIEFPLIYYFISILYKIFGYHEFIYKLVNVIIGFIGLYYLFRLGLRMFRNPLYAIILPMLIFTSPMYVYYLNNFITEATSLSIVFIGLFYFYRFYENDKHKDLIVSLAVFAFAGLMKTPALLLFFAIIGVFGLELVFKVKFKELGKIFNKWPVQALYFVGVMILIFGWYAYAKIYTDNHGGVVSNVEIRPIWILSSETITHTWEVIKARFWSGNYHHPIFLIITLAMFIYNMVFWKKFNRMLNWLVVLNLFGGICFSILFYRSLLNHDYYEINNLIICVLIVMNFLLYIKNNHTEIYNSWITKVILTASVLLMIVPCERFLNTEMYGSWFSWDATERINSKYDDITPYLRSLGIAREDLVYCTYDPSINITLYLADQKGFTDFGRTSKPFAQNVTELKEFGLQYVIVNDTSRIKAKPSSLGLEQIGNHKGAFIYKVEEE